MNSLLQRLDRSAFTKHAVFAGLTLFILYIYGYYIGTFDQASHLPFLKKTIDPSLFKDDAFFDLRQSHYSYFWLLFIPFYKAGVLEIAMFIAHMGATYLTFWSIWNISKTLFKNTLSSLLAVVSLSLPHIGFSGFPLFEMSLLNRTAALPFEIVAFNYFLQKKYAKSFIILGILYNFHALSVHFILAMMGTSMIITLIQKREWTAFKYTPLFLFTALPVLIWKFSHSGGVPLTAHWEWFQILNHSTFFHLFNFFSWEVPVVNILSAGGIATIFLFYFAKQKTIKNEMHEIVSHFVIGGIIVLFAQLLATNIYPVTIIVQAQVVRIGLFLSLFAYLYMSHIVSTLYTSRHKHLFVCFAVSLLFSISPLFLLLSLLAWNGRNKIALFIVGLCNIGLFFGILISLFFNGLINPHINIWPSNNAYYRAQLWAKNNTPKSARFIIPPALWGLYETEWRYGSERSAVCTLSELLEAAFSPSYISYWKPRFEDVAPGSLLQFKGNTFDNFTIANKAFYSHSANDFISLGKKYSASYLVVEKNKKYPLPSVFENEGYIIYSLTPLNRE